MGSTPTGEIYLDKPWLLMRWDSAHRCVVLEWRAFATSREFQDALTKAVEVGQRRGAFSFVTDTTQLELVSDEDQRWIRHTWAPLAIQSGLKKIAIVIARHGLSKMAIEEMFKGRRTTGLQLDSRTFDSLAEALTWVAET
jgi:hypothetical protein